MATWAADDAVAHSLMTYDQRVDRVRKRFGCGERAAKQAIKVARELNRQRFLDAGLKEELAAKASAILDHALASGDLRTALRAQERLCDMFGLDAPTRMHHSGSMVEIDPERMSDEELAERMRADADLLMEAAKREAAARAKGNAGD